MQLLLPLLLLPLAAAPRPPPTPRANLTSARQSPEPPRRPEAAAPPDPPPNATEGSRPPPREGAPGKPSKRNRTKASKTLRPEAPPPPSSAQRPPGQKVRPEDFAAAAWARRHPNRPLVLGLAYTALTCAVVWLSMRRWCPRLHAATSAAVTGLLTQVGIWEEPGLGRRLPEGLTRGRQPPGGTPQRPNSPVQRAEVVSGRSSPHLPKPRPEPEVGSRGRATGSARIAVTLPRVAIASYEQLLAAAEAVSDIHPETSVEDSARAEIRAVAAGQMERTEGDEDLARLENERGESRDRWAVVSIAAAEYSSAAARAVLRMGAAVEGEHRRGAEMHALEEGRGRAELRVVESTQRSAAEEGQRVGNVLRAEEAARVATVEEQDRAFDSLADIALRSAFAAATTRSRSLLDADETASRHHIQGEEAGGRAAAVGGVRREQLGTVELTTRRDMWRYEELCWHGLLSRAAESAASAAEAAAASAADAVAASEMSARVVLERGEAEVAARVRSEAEVEWLVALESARRSLLSSSEIQGLVGLEENYQRGLALAGLAEDFRFLVEEERDARATIVEIEATSVAGHERRLDRLQAEGEEEIGRRG
eukprot:Hpha_TRINITY_DN29661_c0_g1::TRINITY_DN29661_c0_g1_i1::g.165154::m.165154